jgi:hypothetical protein
MPRTRWLIPLLLLAAAPFLLAACGGDDDDSGSSQDEDDITAVIEESVSTTDPAGCTELQTQTFVEQTSFETGDAAIAQCEEDAAETADDPDSVEVSDISVDGEAATASVTFAGGAFDGSTVLLDLVKEGDQWKLNEITDIPEFNFEGFITAFTEQTEAEGEIPPQIAECIVQSFETAGADQIKEVILSGDGEQLTGIFSECLPS